MKKNTAIQTHDFDLGAVYMVATDRRPELYREPGDSLVTLVLPNDQITREVMMAYASGELKINVKRFASCRNWLYRQAKEVKQ